MSASAVSVEVSSGFALPPAHAYYLHRSNPSVNGVNPLTNLHNTTVGFLSAMPGRAVFDSDGASLALLGQISKRCRHGSPRPAVFSLHFYAEPIARTFERTDSSLRAKLSAASEAIDVGQ